MNKKRYIVPTAEPVNINTPDNMILTGSVPINDDEEIATPTSVDGFWNKNLWAND